MSNFLAKELHRSKYRLLGLVGQGQFGRVYCAVHRKSGRLVALKELDRDRFSTHKFLRELRFLLSFQHENIVTCQALEHTATGRYLVMDYCEGGTLRNLMEEGVLLHPRQGLKLVQQILAGLDHAHQRNIVHCDIKPENILLNVTADGWKARISDFGIARLTQELTHDAFSNTGSPAYMAPERFYGQHSAASDLYAVGILLFELLLGYRPFSGPPADLMSAHLNQAVKFPESLPEEMQGFLRHALQKLPARRFRSAGEMLQQLQVVGDRTVEALSQGWSDCSVLRLADLAQSQPFQPCYAEALPIPVSQIVDGQLTAAQLAAPIAVDSAGGDSAGAAPVAPAIAAENPFFRVFGCRVGYQTVADPASPVPDRVPEPELGAESPALRVVRLPEAIAQLAVGAQGGIAVTRQSIYLLPLPLFQAHVAQHGQRHLQHSRKGDRLVLHAVPQLIAEFDHKITVAIAPNQRWLAAIAETPTAPAAPTLNIWHLHYLRPFQPQVQRPVPACFQVLALDAAHLALFRHTTNRDGTTITGFGVEVYTRRGHAIGHLKLPIPLRQLVSTPFPYRLLATEPSYPNTVLILDLKPLKIQRLDLPIAPKFLLALAWGYLFMSASGEIVACDRYGQFLGQVTGPPNPTAIAAIANNKLAIANWRQTEGNLYLVDLAALGLDILF